MRVVKKTESRKLKRGNVSRLNILFVFLLFPSEKMSSSFLFRGEKKRRVEERKI
jgi:hypothetical protein